MNQESKYLLSVLIPTYNRGRFLDRLLTFFSDSELFREYSHVEIVVANNCSQDDSSEVAKKYLSKLPNLKIVNHTEHVPSAEENVFRSFKHCSGEYTWVLGDDDIPVFDNFKQLIGTLEQRKFDFLIFNSPVIGGDGTITSHAVLQFRKPVYTADIRDVAAHNGYWFVLAGMSHQILRSSVVKAYDFKPLLQKSVIYSHVAAYLDCFQSKVTACFNFPIVWYKVTFRDIGHWQAAARKLNVFDEFFWTLGFIRQLQFLIDRKVLSRDVLFYSMDQNEFRKFRLINVIVEKFFEQVLSGYRSRDPRQRMSEADFYELYNFLSNSSVFLRETLWDIERLYKMPKARRLLPGLSKEVRQMVSVVRARFAAFNKSVLYGFFVRQHKSFSIFRIGSRFYAVRTGHESVLERELCYVDVTAVDHYLYFSDSLAQLCEDIDRLENPSVRHELDTPGGLTELVREKDLVLQRYQVLLAERERLYNDHLHHKIIRRVAQRLRAWL